MDEAKKFQDEKSKVWENKDKRSLRAMCLSYAKDLVVGGRLEEEQMMAKAQEMFEWAWKCE